MLHHCCEAQFVQSLTWCNVYPLPTVTVPFQGRNVGLYVVVSCMFGCLHRMFCVWEHHAPLTQVMVSSYEGDASMLGDQYTPFFPLYVLFENSVFNGCVLISLRIILN